MEKECKLPIQGQLCTDSIFITYKQVKLFSMDQNKVLTAKVKSFDIQSEVYIFVII